MGVKNIMRKLAFATKMLFDLKNLRRRLEIQFNLESKIERYENVVFMVSDAKLKDKALAYKNPQKAFDEMTTYLWAVPTIPTPFVGEAPAPGRYGCSVVNSQQFRHPTEVVLPKPKGTCRIFFTGGSAAFCSGAPNDDTTISAYLQKLLDRRLTPTTGIKYEVVNAACTGWASTYERLWIELKLVEMEPDLIIQFSGSNEAYWGARNYSAGWMRGYGEQLFWKMVSSWYAYFGRKQITDNAPREEVKVAPGRVAQTMAKNVRYCMLLLNQIKVPYVFILQPTLSETKKELTKREQALKEKDQNIPYFQQCYSAMRQALAKIETTINPPIDGESVKLLDYSYIFDSYGAGDEIFLDYCHFGDRGNEVIAAKIFVDLATFLEKSLPLSRQQMATVKK